MVLPVTSCEAECSFSTLWHVKTYLHSMMTQERLSGLDLMNIHLPTSYMPSPEEVISKFPLQRKFRGNFRGNFDLFDLFDFRGNFDLEEILI